jgi:hypothetical protein
MTIRYERDRRIGDSACVDLLKRSSLAILLTVTMGVNGSPSEAEVSASLQQPRPARDAHPGLVCLSEEGLDFVYSESGTRFVAWGFNYDHDVSGRLLEDYWQTEWSTVVEDFQEMKALGANVVRVHPQLGKFMATADRPNEGALERLGRLVELAEATGLYLAITGLGCYHKAEVPGWYDALNETQRWTVQARFWEAIAERCAESDAVFCYDLMNEPILPGEGEQAGEWVAGEFGGKHFVQRITLDLAGRTRPEVARAWVHTLVAAIRKHDERHLVTVGVIPWVHTFPNAKPLFYSKEVGEQLDFVSVHFYPKKGEVDRALTALAAYDVGKPLLIEETFPLWCSEEEFDAFMTASAERVDGCIGFYWGKTIEEYSRPGTDIAGSIMKNWLEYFRAQGPEILDRGGKEAQPISPAVDEERPRSTSPPRFVVEEALDLAKVPSGFPVRFCLLTEGRQQYVAYYDEHRRMTVASRTIDSSRWRYHVLPSKVGWDSHNYLTMAVDRDGHLHVSGNMHCVELIYFRTEEPGDITTLKRLGMTGEEEDLTTYPRFLTDHRGELIFTYRHGRSGNGRRIYNEYDLETRTWSRLLDEPLLDGEGERNAYPFGPIRGQDGWFHIVWVWRDTPDCATNHHLSYARSRDLVHWESISGEEVELPIRLDHRVLWVDPIPVQGGIINGCEKLFIDCEDRVIITYHKADPEGNMQVYAARFEEGQWMRHVLTDWKTPIQFSGRGTMGFIGIKISGLSRVAPHVLAMEYRHRDYGRGRLLIDERTLQPSGRDLLLPDGLPDELKRVRSDFEGMEIRRAHDLGQSGESQVRYLLQWETLPSNFDRPRRPPMPEPSVLRLYKLVAD